MNNEMWSIGEGQSYLYTEDRAFARFLKQKFGRCATYERDGRVYAWQFLLSTQTAKDALKKWQKLSTCKSTSSGELRLAAA